MLLIVKHLKEVKNQKLPKLLDHPLKREYYYRLEEDTAEELDPEYAVSY